MLAIFDEQQKDIFHHSKDRVEQGYMGAMEFYLQAKNIKVTTRNVW